MEHVNNVTEYFIVMTTLIIKTDLNLLNAISFIIKYSMSFEHAVLLSNFQLLWGKEDQT